MANANSSHSKDETSTKVDKDLALKIYTKASATPKVIAAFIERREFDKILTYSKQVGYTLDYIFLLKTILRTDAQGALDFALLMLRMEGGCPVDYNTITDLFLQMNLIREATAFLLDVLKPDLPEHGNLQTKVLEINLKFFPNVADAILAKGMFSHYDRPHIAKLCEKAGLFIRALQNYTKLSDIKHVIVNTDAIEPEAGHIRLIKPYMVAVQSSNVFAVNEALNEIYVEEEDYDRLRESIDLYDNFNEIGLAQKIEKNELLEMRRIAAYIYKKAGRWKQSIALLRKDKLYKDCMETCHQSGDQELSEDLLVYFIEQGKKECFASCLFACYDLIRPDVALELAWTNNMIDFSFPYLLQSIREYTSKVDELIKDKIEAGNEKKLREKEREDMIAKQIPSASRISVRIQSKFRLFFQSIGHVVSNIFHRRRSDHFVQYYSIVLHQGCKCGLHCRRSDCSVQNYILHREYKVAHQSFSQQITPWLDPENQ